MSRNIGYHGEDIALKHYEHRGYTLVQKNYTIRGGEIDLILSKDNNLVFVEVKVINSVNDIFGYISQKKLNFVYKTIKCYLSDKDETCDYRLDAVFIKDKQVYEIYENINL